MPEEIRNSAENAQEQDLSKILRVRRDKLKLLQDEGRDPFQITKYDQTHHSQQVTAL